MRKQDIKPGVIYAHQRNRDGSDRPEPVVFLTGTGTLFTRASTYRSPGEPQYTRAREGTRPGLGSTRSGRSTGYAAVRVNWGTGREDSSPQDLLKPTIDDFRKVTSSTQTGVKGTRFDLVTSLTQITGPYDEVLAAWNERQDADRRQREQDRNERAGREARTNDIIDRMYPYGICPGVPEGVRKITLTLDEAEKLLTLLESHDRTQA